MKQSCKRFAVSLMSRVLEVSRSGYYQWVRGVPSARAREDERLKIEIRAAHQRTRETYGPRRLQPELAASGVQAGRDRIARLRRSMGLYCRQRRRFKATTDSGHTMPVAPNLLNQEFQPTAPNQVWVSDLTYVATCEGWLYLAGIKDVFTCEIVGYAMGERMKPELTGRALFRAVQQHRPAAGIIHHSDRGSQYCSREYRKILRQFRFRVSMSRKGNCFDNAPMESFWGSLKTEMVHHRTFATRDEAVTAIREYIEVFYNRQRRHSRLGYNSPVVFARNFR
jgi:putative transposase